MASTTTPGFVVTVDYIHVFTSGLVLLSCQHPDSGCRSALGYSVFQTLFPPPLSPPTNYQTEGSGARLIRAGVGLGLGPRLLVKLYLLSSALLSSLQVPWPRCQRPS